MANYAEERERSRRRPSDLDPLPQAAADTAGTLQRGRRVPVPGGSVPSRTIAAMVLFVVAFLAVWALMWWIGGGLGLALGWIVAGAAGAWLVKAWTDRLPASP